MKTPPKSSAKVYRDAARKIYDGRYIYSCNAIGCFLSPVRAFYQDIFDVHDKFFDTQEERMIALLLAAEIVERDGL